MTWETFVSTSGGWLADIVRALWKVAELLGTTLSELTQDAIDFVAPDPSAIPDWLRNVLETILTPANLLIGDWTLLELILGGGVVFFLAVTLIKWIGDIFGL